MFRHSEILESHVLIKFREKFRFDRREENSDSSFRQFEGKYNRFEIFFNSKGNIIDHSAMRNTPISQKYRRDTESEIEI